MLHARDAAGFGQRAEYPQRGDLHVRFYIQRLLINLELPLVLGQEAHTDTGGSSDFRSE